MFKQDTKIPIKAEKLQNLYSLKDNFLEGKMCKFDGTGRGINDDIPKLKYKMTEKRASLKSRKIWK